MISNDFFEDVWALVRLVPKGKVTTYGAIAKFLGMEKSARMVGWAMNASHAMADVPAHRVVNRCGVLSGKHHFSSPDVMKRLLMDEGVEVADDQIVGFKNYFWDPESLLTSHGHKSIMK
jgi:methylated-DNA-protein-cysteine methyltransferase-like protein